MVKDKQVDRQDKREKEKRNKYRKKANKQTNKHTKTEERETFEDVVSPCCMLICQLLGLRVATWLLQYKNYAAFFHRTIVLAPVPVADVTEEQDVGLGERFSAIAGPR
jgi:hypothetical protein